MECDREPYTQGPPIKYLIHTMDSQEQPRIANCDPESDCQDKCETPRQIALPAGLSIRSQVLVKVEPVEKGQAHGTHAVS